MKFRQVLMGLVVAMSVVVAAGSVHAAVGAAKVSQVSVAPGDVAVVAGPVVSASVVEAFEAFQVRAGLAKPVVALEKDAVMLSGGCTLGHCLSICPVGPRGTRCVSLCLDEGNCGGAQHEN